MADRKERMSLLSRYSQLHFAKYGTRPTHNLNAEQWAADSLIESYGLPKCYDLLAYYFDASQSPSWKYFANYAEKVLEAQEQTQQDLKERAERRQLAREWLNG